MDSNKILLKFDKDKLFTEYHYTTVGKFYVTYEDYLKERGLSSFKNVSVNHFSMISFANQYTIIDHKQFFLTKIKYGI